VRHAHWISAALLMLACGRGDRQTPPESAGPAEPPPFEPPVVTNPESPVSYPPDLYDQQVEGTVVLRLYVDERGVVVPESTRIAESSGYPSLDSAALRGVPAMHFAPARRDGQAVATTFLQPVNFRHSAPSGGAKP
jgi:TonB family protein